MNRVDTATGAASTANIIATATSTQEPGSAVTNSGNASCSVQDSTNNNTCPDTGTPRATVVGLGTGLGIGVPLAAALAGALILLQREKKRGAAGDTTHGGAATAELPARRGAKELGNNGEPVHEIGVGGSGRWDMGGRRELPGFSVER